MKDRTELRVIFIAGAGRSGSTLLERLLGQCDGCVSGGELRHLGSSGALTGDGNSSCSCGQTFEECWFWGSVARGLRERGWEPDEMEEVRARLDRIRYIPRILTATDGSRFGRDLARFRRYQADLYELIADVGSGRTVVDSSKDPSSLFLVLGIPGIELEVVHLVRDPRAVAYSWTTKKRKPEVLGRRAYMRRYGVSRSAAFWVATNALAQAGGRRADAYQGIRYEDFVRMPAATVQGILGLQPKETPFINGRIVSFPRQEHLASGNPGRFQVGSVEISSDDRWVSKLSTASKCFVTSICLPAMIRHGYSPGNPRPSTEQK